MTEFKLAPNLPDWTLKHANRYLASGGADGHMQKMTQPGRPEITIPALLLTTTGRKSGERFIFPLFYGKTGNSYIVVASKGGAPQHPGWYRNILANPDVDVQVGTAQVRRGPGPPPARSAPGYGKRRWSSGPLTPITSARPSARSRWSCSTPSADINRTAPALTAARERHAATSLVKTRPNRDGCTELAVTIWRSETMAGQRMVIVSGRYLY